MQGVPIEDEAATLDASIAKFLVLRIVELNDLRRVNRRVRPLQFIRARSDRKPTWASENIGYCHGPPVPAFS